MQDNLPELRDIHLPEGVSAWPPAYGWWVILAAVCASFLLWRLWLFILSKSKKRYALSLLGRINNHNVVAAALQVSEILRRICVYKYRDAAVLWGADWIAFLNARSKRPLNGKAAELLINAPYIDNESTRYGLEDVRAVEEFARRWIGENL